ncbi:MAG: serine/threonine protein kinase [Deltaproteobacteria bacterium]|nr:serine/threonine protein kinase [Deltaproteobacteria bacterium]
MGNAARELRDRRDRRVDTPVSGVSWIGHGSPMGPPTSVSPAPTRTQPAEAREAAPIVAAPPLSEEMVALRREEMIRLRHFGLWCAILCAGGLINQLFSRDASPLKATLTIALVSLTLTSAWLSYSARDPNGYDAIRLRLRTFAIVAILTAFVLQLRLGLFSPVSAALVFGLQFFGRSENRRVVLFLSTVTIVAYFVAAGLIALDVVADPGLYAAPPHLAPITRFGTVVMTAAVYVVTVVQARQSRTSAEGMVKAARDAAIEARNREIQLQEANQNLDRALRAAAGRRGRYSGARAGSWVVGELVGRGAMGEVYAARHAYTRAPGAVKLLHATSATFGEDPSPRFLREARIAASLRAPNLVDVYEIGEAEDGAPFMAMELLQGRDLAFCLRRTPRMALADVVRLAKDVAAGLSVAHAAGVVHRDLKPQNLFLDLRHSREGRWKVLDFGVCTMADSSGTLTADGIVGTPAYMAPEQARGERTDARSDLFALGSVIYRCLTGQPAFTGPGAPQIVYAVAFESPIAPRELAPALPPAVEAVLAIMLAKDPRDRFASATALAEALEHAAMNEIAPALEARAVALLTARPWKAVRGPALG